MRLLLCSNFGVFVFVFHVFVFVTLRLFSDLLSFIVFFEPGEIGIRVNENVRGKDVYIVQVRLPRQARGVI